MINSIATEVEDPPGNKTRPSSTESEDHAVVPFAHPCGRIISCTEMLWNLCGFSYVNSNESFLHINSTPWCEQPAISNGLPLVWTHQYIDNG